MSSALIFGGSGKCARHITRLLVSSSYTVHSIIRSPSQTSELESLGAKPIVQSIEESSIDDFVSTIKSTNPSVVIWAAGAGGGNPERTRSVDQEGAIKCFDSIAKAGTCKRFIIISALDVRDRESKPEPEWYNDNDRQSSDRVWGAIGPYMHAKFAADRNLVTQNGRRGLEYTIVRPGRLTEDTARGTVAAGKVHLGEAVSREDVAHVVVACIKNDGTRGMAFDVVGGDTPVEQAIAEVVKTQADTFAGRY
ncbi:hypothetical protein LTR50_006897 [Elasticomyces elasticus]|nr:hypothetical protein LTR50_006897 [Elasticomyces elasticus]